MLSLTSTMSRLDTDRHTIARRAGRATPGRASLGIRCVLAALGVLVATACAPGSLGPFFAPGARPTSGGELYVYRVDGVPSQGRARLRIGASFQAKLANGEYTRLALPSGPHVVKLQFRGLPWTWGWDEIPILLKEREVLYLRLAGGVQQTNWRERQLDEAGPRSERYGPALLRGFVSAEIALSELPACRLTMDVED
jgi:hypothetical protein